MGYTMVQQAQKLGAKTFVHYSIPRQMIGEDYPASLYSERRNRIREKCGELSIKFIDATILPSMYADHPGGVLRFFKEEISKMVEEYGKDTAFFCTYNYLQTALLKAVIESGAICPQPPIPSPLGGFTQALELSLEGTEVKLYGRYYSIFSADEAISKITSALAEKDMLGRLSTWPVEDISMYTAIGAEYAIKWINGEVPKDGVDVDVLKQLMEEYAGVEVYLTPYTDEYPYTDEGTGETYDNFLMMRMDYITFE